MRSNGCLVILLALNIIPVARGTDAVVLKADARWQLEFAALPDTLATLATGKRQPARLTARLPANYSRDGKFPLFVFLNGGDGGRGDTLPLDRTIIGSNDFICVNLPLFKRAFDTKDGVLVTVDDFETISRAYRIMLQKLFDVVPNITPERSALGGFSNGAHATALLLAGQDEFVLRHFRSFYFVEGGSPLAANALHRTALKNCRFLLMRGDKAEAGLEGKAYGHLAEALEHQAKEHQLNFTYMTMRSTGHAFPQRYQFLLGQWIRGERMLETE